MQQTTEPPYKYDTSKFYASTGKWEVESDKFGSRKNEASPIRTVKQMNTANFRYSKVSAPGMDLIMANESLNLVTPRKRRIEQPDQSLAEAVAKVWSKVMERHRTTSDAFRFFDLQGKGKIKKSDFIRGLEQLRLRLAPADIDLVWRYVDQHRRGYANFNDFCMLGHKPSSVPPKDLFSHELLSQIRRQDRHRIAKEMFSSVQQSQRLSSAPTDGGE